MDVPVDRNFAIIPVKILSFKFKITQGIRSPEIVVRYAKAYTQINKDRFLSFAGFKLAADDYIIAVHYATSPVFRRFNPIDRIFILFEYVGSKLRPYISEGDLGAYVETAENFLVF